AIIGADGIAVPFEVEGKVEAVYSLPIQQKTRGESPAYACVPDHWMPADRTSIVMAGDVPAMGYRTWKIGFIPKKDVQSIGLPESMKPVTSDAGSKTLENEFVTLTAREDGMVDLLDKATGTWYRGLHELEDCGDKGNGWDHFYPKNDTVVKSTDAGARGPVKIRVRQTSPLTASMVVSYSMKVPADLSPDKESRVRKTATIGIETVFTLDAGTRRVDCKTNIRNTARNHRIRAIFPTDRTCSTWFADTAFDMVERAIKLPDTTGWLEQSREESPIKNIAAANDGKSGFAVLTKGLQEACVQDNDNRSLALTLFRGFEENLGGYLTQESQLLGDISLEYAILPFTPNAGEPPVHLFNEVEKYKMPLIAFTSSSHAGEMSPHGRFIEVSDNLVLSTVKMSEDRKATIIRLFNPSPHEVESLIRFNLPVSTVNESDMLENMGVQLQSGADGSYLLKVKAKGILTLRCER
ncbi:MAG: glycosyl hydrolase-related protein, partial [Chloroflexi bacterium]|nr:glycosyl hydrolase-related protein [Chloroflexota bacterium]